MEADNDIIFFYTPPGRGVRARCRIRIYRAHAAVVVITELPDNPGTSVTNAIEYIATCVMHDYKLDPRTTTWVEHYPGQADRPETWDVVTFEWIGNAVICATTPRWRPSSAEEVRRMIGAE